MQPKTERSSVGVDKIQFDSKLHLQGGPGGSSLFGLFSEIGPYGLSKDKSTGLLALTRRKETWVRYLSLFITLKPGVE